MFALVKRYNGIACDYLSVCLGVGVGVCGCVCVGVEMCGCGCVCVWVWVCVCMTVCVCVCVCECECVRVVSVSRLCVLFLVLPQPLLCLQCVSADQGLVAKEAFLFHRT